MTMLVIANKNYSSWSLRAWLALKHTGIAFEEKVIPLRMETTSSEISKHSPSRLLPVLHHNGNRIWDSLAIGEYLAEQFPESGLLPKDNRVKAFTRSVIAEMHSGFQPLRMAMPMNLRQQFPASEWSDAVKLNIERICAIWDMCKEWSDQSGPYLLGQFSLVDCFYAPVAARFRSYAVVLPEDAARYVDTIYQQSYFKEWYKAACEEPWSIPAYDTLAA